MAEMPAYWKVVETAVVGEGFVRGVFSGPVRLNRSTRYKKVVVRPVVIKGERMLSFSYWDSKHDTTKNVKPEAAGEILREVLAIGFANVHLKTAGEEVAAGVPSYSFVVVVMPVTVRAFAVMVPELVDEAETE